MIGLALLLACQILPPPPDVDQWPYMQGLVNATPEGATILVPEGSYRLSKTLVLKTGQTLQGQSLNARLVGYGDYPGPVVGWGQFGWVGDDQAQRHRSNGVRVVGLTIEQQRENNPQQKCIFSNDGDDAYIAGCRFIGSAYEAVVPAGYRDRGAVVEDCTFENCGRVGLSSINVYCRWFVVRRNIVRMGAYGQGIETGGHGGLIEDNQLIGSGNNLGINIGSQNSGVYALTTRRNRVLHCSQAFMCCNTNGRLSGLNVEDNYFCGMVSFSGGRPNNLVINPPMPEPMPDTSKSTFRNNVIHLVHSMTDGLVYQATNADFGREPLDVLSNTVIVSPGVNQTLPLLRAWSNVTAPVRFDGNTLIGLDKPAQYDLSGGQTLSYGTNHAFKADGSPRQFFAFVPESPAPEPFPVKFSEEFTQPVGEDLVPVWLAPNWGGWNGPIIRTATGRGRCGNTATIGGRSCYQPFLDGEVEATFTAATDEGYAGLWLRTSDTSRTGYLAFYNQAAGALWSIQRWENGAATNLSGFRVGFGPGGAHTVRLRVVGSIVTLVIDGKAKAATYDPNPLPAGRAGLLLWQAAGSEETGVHADDFTARVIE